MQMEPTLSPEENQEQQQAAAEESVENSTNDSEAAEAVKEDKKTGPNLEELSLEDYPTAIEKILKDDQWMKMGANRPCY